MASQAFITASVFMLFSRNSTHLIIKTLIKMKNLRQVVGDCYISIGLDKRKCYAGRNKLCMRFTLNRRVNDGQGEIISLDSLALDEYFLLWM